MPTAVLKPGRLPIMASDSLLVGQVLPSPQDYLTAGPTRSSTTVGIMLCRYCCSVFGEMSVSA